MRTPINLQARIHCSRGPAVRARVRDVSMGGMGIDAGAGFFVHQPVVVEFGPVPDGRRRWRWRGVVVRVSDDAFGLMFERFHAADVAALVEPVRRAADRRPGRDRSGAPPPGAGSDADVSAHRKTPAAGGRAGGPRFRRKPRS